MSELNLKLKGNNAVTYSKASTQAMVKRCPACFRRPSSQGKSSSVNMALNWPRYPAIFSLWPWNQCVQVKSSYFLLKALNWHVQIMLFQESYLELEHIASFTCCADTVYWEFFYVGLIFVEFATSLKSPKGYTSGYQTLLDCTVFSSRHGE